MKTIHRKSVTDHFTILPNSLLRDKRLSFKARGVVSMMLSMPDDWQTYASWVQEQGLEGKDALQGAFSELEMLGYLARKSERDKESGRIIGSIWHWNSEPVAGKPEAGNPPAGYNTTTKDLYEEETREQIPIPAINAGEVLRLDSPMPIPKRRGRPPLPADPRFQPFISAYSDGYIKTFGEKYYFQPKDAKQLQGFLRICDKDIQELIHIVSWCWERSKEKFCPAFVRASTIFDFCQNWPKIIVEAQKQQ